MKEQEEPKKSFFVLRWLRVETDDELYYLLAPVIAVFGCALMVLGAFLGYWGLSEPETKFKDFAVDHSGRVMAIGFLNVLLAFVSPLVLNYKKLRDRSINIEITGDLVQKKELKQSAFKGSK